MNNKKIDKRKLLVKIIVPVLIMIALTIIWLVKNQPTPTKNDEQIVNNTDFVLETTAIEIDTLKAYGLPIIIDFGADSCIPCKEMAPILKTLNTEMQGEAIIKFVDVWKNPDSANDFPVQVIPTQVLYGADGAPYVPSDSMEIKFEMYVYKETGDHAFTTHQGGLTDKQLRAILTDMGIGK